MKLYDLFESRRNPENNPKSETKIKSILEYLSTLNDLTQYGVTFTSELKLGINPKTNHNTVAGIYFYPATYFQSVKGRVPYADGYKYSTIIKLNGNILNITTISEEEVLQKFSNLEEIIPELCNQSNKDIDEIFLKYKEIKEKYSKSKYPGTKLWQTIWQLSRALTNSNGSKNIYKWNKILRNLGYDIVIDNGSGTIHPNESTQGVALISTAVSSVKAFEDTKHIVDPKNNLSPAPYDAHRASAAKIDAMRLSTDISGLWPHRNESLDFVNKVMDNLSRANKNKQASKDILDYYNKVIDYAVMVIINKNYIKNISKSNMDLLYKFSSPAIKKKIQSLSF